MPQTDLEFLCSAVSYSVILWTVAGQAPLSMEFSRQEYWSGLPFPTPGDLLDPGVKPSSLASLALAEGFLTSVPLGKLNLDLSKPRGN